MNEEAEGAQEMEAERLVGTVSPQFAAAEKKSSSAAATAAVAAGGAAVISHLATGLDLLHQYGPRNVTGKRGKRYVCMYVCFN